MSIGRNTTTLRKACYLGVLLIVACALVLGIRAILLTGPAAAPQATRATRAPAVHADTPHPAARNVAGLPAQPTAPFDWRTMRKRYDTATNLRAFFYAALDQPKEGGIYYASVIKSTCRKNLSIATDALPVRQREAVETLRKRCDFSLSELDDADRQFQAKRDLNFSDDPILARVIASLQAPSDTARAAVLDAALADGDPEVIGSLLASTAANTIEATISKDPKTVSIYAEETVLLVQCQLGTDCTNPDAMRTLTLCTQHGWCADNVRDALRIGLGSDFERLDLLARQMTRDLHNHRFTSVPQPN